MQKFHEFCVDFSLTLQSVVNLLSVIAVEI